MKEIIACTGYGATGSSAATNILEEFSDIKSLSDNFECTFLHEVDGLSDLEKALREGHRLKTDLAIKRFLRLSCILNKNLYFIKYFNWKFKKHSIEFVNSICAAQWNGAWHRSSDTIKYSKQDLLYHNLAKQVFLNEYSYSHYSLFEPNGWRPSSSLRNKMYYAHFDDSFYEKAQKYVNDLMAEIAKHTDAKRILIDQFFPAYDITSYLNYAPKTKTVIVDRDPRDMYVLNKSSWGEAYIPTDDVDVFIKWYKGIRFSQKKEAENTQVLLCHFEDFIFDYEASLLRLMQFIGLEKSEHVKKLERFNPEKSIKNTNLFNSFPKWKADVKKIETELSEYCYNFPDGSTLSNNSTASINDDRSVISKTVKSSPLYIEDFIKQANAIQVEKKLPTKYKPLIAKFLFGMTRFGTSFTSFSQRYTLKSKIKGLIKCTLYLPSFVFEYIYLFCTYLKYRKS